MTSDTDNRPETLNVKEEKYVDMDQKGLDILNEEFDKALSEMKNEKPLGQMTEELVISNIIIIIIDLLPFPFSGGIPEVSEKLVAGRQGPLLLIRIGQDPFAVVVVF